MNLAKATLVLGVCSLVSLHRDLTGDPIHTVAEPLPVQSRTTLGSLVVTDVQQLSGLHLRSGNTTLTILTWVLGATPGGDLTSAYLVALDEEGRLIDYDGSEHCSRVFERPSEIADVRVWNPIKQAREYAEVVKLIVREDQSLGMVLGAPEVVAIDLDQDSTACAWIPYNTCYPGGGCLYCPDNPPSCPCNHGQSNCSHIIGKSCPSDGLCTIEERCTSNGETCSCQPI